MLSFLKATRANHIESVIDAGYIVCQRLKISFSNLRTHLEVSSSTVMHSYGRNDR